MIKKGIKGLKKIRREQRLEKQKQAQHNSTALVDYIGKLENRVKVLEHSMLKVSGLMLLIDKHGIKWPGMDKETHKKLHSGLNAGLTLIAGELLPKEEE